MEWARVCGRVPIVVTYASAANLPVTWISRCEGRTAIELGHLSTVTGLRRAGDRTVIATDRLVSKPDVRASPALRREACPVFEARDPRILVVTGRMMFDLEARDGTQGKNRTRARLCGAKKARHVLVRSAGLSRLLRGCDLGCTGPKEGIASPLLLQRVPEPKAGKNRMHLDIVVEDIEPEVQRLQELGAHRIDEGVKSFGGTSWVRMLDPEQNEFCVSTGVEW
jgi:hypothetical protein